MWICFTWLRVRTSYELVGLKMTDSFLTSLDFVSCSRMFVLHAVQMSNVLSLWALFNRFKVLVSNVLYMVYVYNIFTGKIHSETCKILPTPRMNFVISYHLAR